ncbi:hypothetical protein Cme02nite_12190 [Catellatospora methionotrophica]|uniref:Uncharacterized protein n=1 Tax=Catellatospora methionotrophica TaxID=121620 RepID=A0A8J3PDB1_9ACTN|nr:hypothetical protein Cme02nite_12190 [Catellatospora methionotrophica]
MNPQVQRYTDSLARSHEYGDESVSVESTLNALGVHQTQIDHTSTFWEATSQLVSKRECHRSPAPPVFTPVAGMFPARVGRVADVNAAPPGPPRRALHRTETSTPATRCIDGRHLITTSSRNVSTFRLICSVIGLSLRLEGPAPLEGGRP